MSGVVICSVSSISTTLSNGSIVSMCRGPCFSFGDGAVVTISGTPSA